MKLKKTLLSFIACALSSVLLFAFTACNGNKDPEATGVSIDLTTVGVAIGDTQRLNATVSYSDGSEVVNPTELVWTSSSETVATVTRGIVSGKGEGTATVTAAIGEYNVSCEVTVYELVVELSDEKITVAKGETRLLTATVKKDGVAVDGEAIEWSSSDEAKATVDENGLVSALLETEEDSPVIITAKRKNGNQTATCALTITWEKPEGFVVSNTYEQNKSPAGMWNFWNDKNYNWTDSEVYEAYGEKYEKSESYPQGAEPDEGYVYIGAEKVTISFEVDKPDVNFAAIQLFFRSSTTNEGLLLPNHNYEVKLKLESNVSGQVNLNGFDDVRPRAEDESEEDYNAYLDSLDLNDHVFDIEANKVNILTVTFRHGDSGAIYKNGVYDNVESAIQLLLGKLAGRVTVSVYDVQYKDLGESEYQWNDDPAKIELNFGNLEDLEEGETFYADYSNLSETCKGTGDGIVENEWAFWWVMDAGWGCGEVVDFEKSIDADSKSITTTFAKGENNWSVQLHYKTPDVVVGKAYKLSLTITSDTAYAVSLNGKSIDLVVGENNVEVYFGAGDWAIDMSMANTANKESITLTLSDIQWTELITG